jgi:GNAT superfamily N-acetyltransferase
MRASRTTGVLPIAESPPGRSIPTPAQTRQEQPTAAGACGAGFPAAAAGRQTGQAEILARLDLGLDRVTLRRGRVRRGALRAQIEAVRVPESYRNRGLGAALFTAAIDESRRRHCALVQLTTHKSRTSAHRFYDQLGFAAAHEGMKLLL